MVINIFCSFLVKHQFTLKPHFSFQVPGKGTTIINEQNQGEYIMFLDHREADIQKQTFANVAGFSNAFGYLEEKYIRIQSPCEN